MIEVKTLHCAGCSQASNSMARLQPPPTPSTWLPSSPLPPLQSTHTPLHCRATPRSSEAGRMSTRGLHSLRSRPVLSTRASLSDWPTPTAQGLLLQPHVRNPAFRNSTESLGLPPRVTSRGLSRRAASPPSLIPNPSPSGAVSAAASAQAASLDSPAAGSEAHDVSPASANESADEGDLAASDSRLSVKERRRRRNHNRLQYLDPDAVQQRQQAAEDRIMDIMVPKRRTPAARKKPAAPAPEAAATAAAATAAAGDPAADAAGGMGSEEEKGGESENAKSEGKGSEDGGGRGLEEDAGPLFGREGAEVGPTTAQADTQEPATEGEGGESEEAPVVMDPIARLERLGVRWWGLSAVSSMEFEVQGVIETLFSERFPDSEIKIFVPYAPTKRASVKTLDGTGAKRIAPGAMYMRCVMTRAVYDGIREVEGLYGFVGHEEKIGRTKLVLPWSIPDQEILTLQQVAQRQHEVQEEAALASKEAARRRRAKAKADREAAVANAPPMEFVPAQRSSSSSSSSRNSRGGATSGSDLSSWSASSVGSTAGAAPLDAGAAQGQGAVASRRRAGSSARAKAPAGTGGAPAKANSSAGTAALRRGSAVQVVKGPYTNLEGKILSLDRETRMTKVGITLLGRTVSMDLPMDALQPLQQPPGGPSDEN